MAGLPEEKRQPNFLLATVRYLAGVQPGYDVFRAVVLDRRAEMAAVMLARRTQTNEPARCATLLPALASLRPPLALLEVGASAGLCLLPDRYGYDYGSCRIDGSRGAPVLTCRCEGPVPLPVRPVEVVWRAGIDINPLDVTDPSRLPVLEPGLSAFLLTRDGREALAYTDSHGTWIRWLA